MNQPELDFTPPFQGKTISSRHASWTGAEHAKETRSRNLIVLQHLWIDPMTMQEVAELSGLPLSSVCSLKACLDLEAVGFQSVEWPGRKPTKRTTWRLKAR